MGAARRAAASIAAILMLPAAADAATVEAGGLRAQIDADPWHLSFADRHGRPVLSENRGTGPGPTGTLGFRAGAAWFHATRVLSEGREGAAYTAELATTDPLRRIGVRIAPDAEGVIRVEAAIVGEQAGVTGFGIGYDARPGERHLGFGERSNAVDQRGREVESYVADGPYQPEERPFLAAFIPPQGYRLREDATYFPMPWLLSTAGHGVLVDNTEESRFRLGSEVPEAWSLEVDARRLAMRVFAGPRPADVLRRLTARLGRQPPPAAPWYLGPWFQPGRQPMEDRSESGPVRPGELGQVDRLRNADAPVSVAQTYLHYLPCGDQTPPGRREQERERTRAFHADGLATTTYFNPMVCTSYQPVFDEAARRGLLTRDPTGQPSLYRYSTSSQFLVGQFDFSAPGASEFYGGLLSEAVADGHDGWMEDFGEYTPPESQSANGMSGLEMHNLYPVLYHRAAHEFTRRAGKPIANFIRSGYTGVQPYARIVWGGDPTSDFGFDGLASAITQGLSIGLSGISIWGSDIGGFFQLGQRRLTPELLIRWIQLGAVSGVMRTQAEGIAVPPKPRPQITDREILPHWRRYAKLRTQLYPYIAAADEEYRRSGLPLMRHLSLAYPDDPRAAGREHEFLFGPDLLAAPVIEPGADRRSLYLPRGRWVDLWRAASYESKEGSLRLGRAALLDGGREVEVPAPLEELPLLVRAGAVLPLLSADVDTLADYGSRSGLVKLADRRDRLELLAFPRGPSLTRLAGGERVRATEGSRRLDIGVAGRQSRSYRLQASVATLERPFTPCCVELDGRGLPRRSWSYDRSTRVLRTTFRTRRGRLTVLARCARARPTDRPRPRGGGRPRFTG